MNHHLYCSSIAKNKIELDTETYNNTVLRMYDLHKRVQHLELQEWKRIFTHDWYVQHEAKISCRRSPLKT